MQLFSIRASAGGWFAILMGVPIALVLDWVVLDGILWQLRAADFPKTTGVVTHSEIIVRHRSRGGMSYILELRYEFTVGEQKYTGTRLRYYPDDGTSRVFVEQLHAEYSLRRAVTVYYPPDDPSLAILRPGIEGTDCVRGLFAFGLSLMVVGGIALVFGKQFGFDPNDPECVRQTENGWEAQMPYTSHRGVFAITIAGACMLASFVLRLAHGPNPPPQLVGSAFAASVALASVGAVLFSRYPRLAADLDAKELVLPAPWFGSPIRVPFDQIGTIAVRHEEKSAGRGQTYTVYNCDVGWGTGSRVQITTIATFLDRVEAEKLAMWLKVTLGRLDAEVDGPGGVFRA